MSAGSAKAERVDASGAVLHGAVVDSVGVDGELLVRLLDGGTEPAKVATLAPYQPTVGDRILVGRGGASVGGGLFVLGALHVAHVGARLDASGDLTLSAPSGRVAVQAGTDIEVTAKRDISERAGRQVSLGVGDSERLALSDKRASLTADTVDVEAKKARLDVGQATVVARQIATTASAMATRVERWELTAERLVETTRDAFREATDLAQTKAGRLRQVVAKTFSVTSKRTRMKSQKDTSIDGKRVLLG